jgi:hypothetical protein
MKKLLIGLLITAAAGTGVYFYFNPKKEDKPKDPLVTKELIIGRWKVATIEPITDSAEKKFSYDFMQEGTALRLISDTVKADTVHYEWNKESGLVIKENPADSIGKVYAVAKLTADTLQLQSAAKSVITLLKEK